MKILLGVLLTFGGFIWVLIRAQLAAKNTYQDGHNLTSTNQAFHESTNSLTVGMKAVSAEAHKSVDEIAEQKKKTVATRADLDKLRASIASATAERLARGKA